MELTEKKRFGQVQGRKGDIFEGERFWFHGKLYEKINGTMARNVADNTESGFLIGIMVSAEKAGS